MATDPRDRILDAAARLLASGGVEGVSTRAVATAAGVQAPTLYRLFGDKQGLIDAVVSLGFERYLANKHALTATDDLIEDMRRGWDLHVEFGLSHPAFYVLMFGNPRPGRPSPSSAEAHRLLLAMVHRAARAGVLAVPAETAAQMVHAACVGVTLNLISSAGAGDADSGAPLDLSHRVREAVFAAIVSMPSTGQPTEDHPLAARAIALDAALDSIESELNATDAEALTTAEMALLRQWLNRLASRPPV